jgi:hypothetical protein
MVTNCHDVIHWIRKCQQAKHSYPVGFLQVFFEWYELRQNASIAESNSEDEAVALISIPTAQFTMVAT